jgi:hypothetical protein
MTNDTPPEKDIGMAELLGKSYAHFQHGLDRAIEWGFSKMNTLEGEEPTEKDIKNPHLRKTINVGRKMVGFVGRAGNTYFRTYEELKKKN